jgi:Activator of Hsp90 ATPase homolog 1-like protein
MAKDFTTTFLVDQSPNEVFKAVTNVRGWWQGLYEEEINGKTQDLHDEFTFRAGGGAHYSKQRLLELVPDKKVVWLVTEGALSFVDKKDEWKGTKIIFDISTKGNKTKVQFTHEGLNPQIECYDSCSSAWQMYLDQKLIPLIKSIK